MNTHKSKVKPMGSLLTPRTTLDSSLLLGTNSDKKELRVGLICLGHLATWLLEASIPFSDPILIGTTSLMVPLSALPHSQSPERL